MKVISFVLIILIPFIKNDNSENVLKQMRERYAGKWMKTFTFTQATETYRNDSLINTSTWYEHVAYPDKFRIDFGSKTAGNAAIFTKDSIYSFRNSSLAHVSAKDEDLTFLLGGMFFYTLDTAKLMLRKMGYDLNKFSENDSVYIIGANKANERSNQLWIDKEKLVVSRFINYTHGNKEEGIFANHKQFGNSWSETFCTFYVDDKLVQKETYFDCKADISIDPGIFDPHHFITLHN